MCAPPHGWHRFEPDRPRIRQCRPGERTFLGDVPNFKTLHHSNLNLTLATFGDTGREWKRLNDEMGGVIVGWRSATVLTELMMEQTLTGLQSTPEASFSVALPSLCEMR